MGQQMIASIPSTVAGYTEGCKSAGLNAVVVLACFVSFLAAAAGSLVLPDFESCHDLKCPKYFYCYRNALKCLPCSSLSASYDLKNAKFQDCLDWPELLETETLYGMLPGRLELTPSCNASVLDDSRLVSAECRGACLRTTDGLAYCFAGTECSATCSLTARTTWTGNCSCQLGRLDENRSQFSCAWSVPPPTSAPASSQTAAPPPPPLPPTASSMSSETGSIVAIISGCMAVILTAALTLLIVLRRSKKASNAKGGKLSAAHGAECSLLLPSSMQPVVAAGQGPPSNTQTTVIVNHVTNNTNVAVMTPLQHLTVSNGTVEGPGLVPQHRRQGDHQKATPSGSDCRASGRPPRCSHSAPITADDSLTAAADDGGDCSRSHGGGSGCGQPLLTTSDGSPPRGRAGSCMQAAASFKNSKRSQRRLCGGDVSDVSIQHLDSCAGCSCFSDPAAAAAEQQQQASASDVHVSPRMEPFTPADFGDTCGRVRDDDHADLEAAAAASLASAGHERLHADEGAYDSDGGGRGDAASETGVWYSAYCSTQDYDGTAGLPLEQHAAYSGHVTINAARVKNCEVFTAAPRSSAAAVASSFAEDCGGGCSDMSTIHLELGHVDRLHVVAVAGDSPSLGLHPGIAT